MGMEKWKIKPSQSKKGKRGLATVRVSKTSVKVVFEDDPDNGYEFALDACPDNVRSGKWLVTLSGQADKMYGFSPIAGAFYMRFVKIACQDGQLPSPMHVSTSFTDPQTKKVVPVEYDAFTCILEIVKGKDAGLQVPYFLRYNFGEMEGDVSFTHGKSKYTKQLQDFMEASGVFAKGPMAYSDNILPALENRMSDKNRIFMVIMKNGYVDSLTETEDPDAPKTRKGKEKSEEDVE